MAGRGLFALGAKIHPAVYAFYDEAEKSKP
jgi:hypothetical protein